MKQTHKPLWPALTEQLCASVTHPCPWRGPLWSGPALWTPLACVIHPYLYLLACFIYNISNAQSCCRQPETHNSFKHRQYTGDSPFSKPRNESLIERSRLKPQQSGCSYQTACSSTSRDPALPPAEGLKFWTETTVFSFFLRAILFSYPFIIVFLLLK